MIIQILILIAGLALVVFGADMLVEGSSSIARKAGLSEFLIGMTIVGIGTSLPELVVSLNGALQGNADIAIGNVIGSNLFNVLLILGVTAIISPIGISSENLHKDIPLNFIASVLLVALGMHCTLFGIGTEDSLSKVSGLIFLTVFIAYLAISIRQGKEEDSGETEADSRKVWVSIVMVLAGLAGLIFGGRFFVDSACEIARIAGMSDKFIAVTILAGGTSLPELVTCVVAALKKKDQLALGNIIGSNISNIFLILGCSAAMFHKTPGGPSGLTFSGMTAVDLTVFILSGVVLWTSAFTGKSKDRRTIGKFDGISFLAIEAIYMFFLISNLNQ